jgi:hypothetical protein
MNWIPFDAALFDRQPLPAERRRVLVVVPATPERGNAQTVAVGYLRYASGEADSPFFVVPGVGGPVTHWCDCLGDDFEAPGWNFPHAPGTAPNAPHQYDRPARGL